MKTLSALFIAGFFSIGILFNLTVRTGTRSGDNPGQRTRADAEMYEKAVAIIKKYEGLCRIKHYPFVGYGHLVMPGEKISRSMALSEKAADALLRKDLRKLCAQFRKYGKDSLILGVLAYNIGPENVRKSSVLKKLASGNRDIRKNYIAHSRYKGKTLKTLQRRRIEEFNTLFQRDTIDIVINKQ